MLKTLLAARPAFAERILGVTGRDLFIPVLSFVFGQAQMDGPTAVISLARLSQAYSGLPEDRPLLLQRARKEALHELGHTFGLVHCPDAACPMSLSTGVVQVDRKGEAFCVSCAALVRERTPVALPPKGGHDESDVADSRHRRRGGHARVPRGLAPRGRLRGGHGRLRPRGIDRARETDYAIYFVDLKMPEASTASRR